MMSRRQFLQTTASGALLSMAGPMAWAGTAVAVRPSWSTFRMSGSLPRFMEAIGQMRANLDATDPTSWAYWTQTHRTHCPHKMPYFLAWHRGLLKRFEGQLRKVSGDPGLSLPYWDYYTDPHVPVEFLDATSPLWRKGRQGDNVAAALTLDPFQPEIFRFARGQADAFEPTVESAPHNPVHNLIGGAMAQVLASASDPIFWVHHANIDRLWSAWVKAGQGRRMPLATSTYWMGRFSYGNGVPTLLRSKTASTPLLGYRYEDEQMPMLLPVLASSSRVNLAVDGAPNLANLAWGERRRLALDDQPVALSFQVDQAEQGRWRDAMANPGVAGPNRARDPQLVLEGVRTTPLGERGGYVYALYLHVDGAPARRTEAHLLGTFGAFEVEVERMRMQMDQATSGRLGAIVTLAFPLLPTLRRLGLLRLGRLRVTWVQVDGGRPRPGTVMEVSSVRLVGSQGSVPQHAPTMPMAA